MVIEGCFSAPGKLGFLDYDYENILVRSTDGLCYVINRNNGLTSEISQFFTGERCTDILFTSKESSKLFCIQKSSKLLLEIEKSRKPLGMTDNLVSKLWFSSEDFSFIRNYGSNFLFCKSSGEIHALHGNNCYDSYVDVSGLVYVSEFIKSDTLQLLLFYKNNIKSLKLTNCIEIQDVVFPSYMKSCELTCVKQHSDSLFTIVFSSKWFIQLQVDTEFNFSCPQHFLQKMWFNADAIPKIIGISDHFIYILAFNANKESLVSINLQNLSINKLKPPITDNFTDLCVVHDSNSLVTLLGLSEKCQVFTSILSRTENEKSHFFSNIEFRFKHSEQDVALFFESPQVAHKMAKKHLRRITGRKLCKMLNIDHSTSINSCCMCSMISYELENVIEGLDSFMFRFSTLLIAKFGLWKKDEASCKEYTDLFATLILGGYFSPDVTEYAISKLLKYFKMPYVAELISLLLLVSSFISELTLVEIYLKLVSSMGDGMNKGTRCLLITLLMKDCDKKTLVKIFSLKIKQFVNKRPFVTLLIQLSQKIDGFFQEFLDLFFKDGSSNCIHISQNTSYNTLVANYFNWTSIIATLGARFTESKGATKKLLRMANSLVKKSVSDSCEFGEIDCITTAILSERDMQIPRPKARKTW